MNVIEAFQILLQEPINKAIDRNKVNNLPKYSSSKGGRYWFDCKMVSEDEIIALFIYALIIEQLNIESTSILLENRNIIFKLDKENNLILPLMDIELAKQIYNERSNGYANFKTCKLVNATISVELGSELCLDELLAIYTLLQEKKKEIIQNLVS